MFLVTDEDSCTNITDEPPKPQLLKKKSTKRGLARKNTELVVTDAVSSTSSTSVTRDVYSTTNTMKHLTQQIEGIE